MKRGRCFLAAGGVLAISTALSGPSAQAAPQVGAEVAQLEETVVTATKTAREVKDVPTNLTVLTAQDIESYQPTDVMDLLRHVPGLVLNGMGSSKASFYAGSRGMQPSTRGMLILMDNVEVNDPSNYLSVAAIPLNKIERIEVIKTPSSVLYGPAAVGGVINIITKKPTQPAQANGSLTYGSHATVNAFADAAGLLENGFSYGLSYNFFDSDGYRDNSFRQQHTFTPTLGYANDRVEVNLSANLVDGEYGFPGGLPLASFDDDPTRASQADRQGNSVNSATGATGTIALSQDTRLKLKTSYRNNDWETEDYGFFFKGENYWAWTGEAAVQQEMRLGSMANTVLIGTEYRKLNNEPSMYTDDNAGSQLLSQAEVQEDIAGFFLQDELRPLPQLMVNLGVRFDTIDTSFINKLNRSADFDSSHEKWSPRLGATYTFAPELNVFANYSQGIRSVNLARSAFQLKSNVEPESEESAEIGIRGTLGKAVGYSLALFQVDTSDKIIQKDRYLYENAGEARSRGVEASVTANLPGNFYVGADYTRIDAEFTDFKTSSTTQAATVSYDGKKVPLVPENIAGLTVGWRSPQFGHVAGSYRYVDDKFLDLANNLTLDGYHVVDCKYTIGFDHLWGKRDRVELSVGINNLLDEAYAEYGEANGGRYASYPVAFPADGRTIFVTLGFSF